MPIGWLMVASLVTAAACEPRSQPEAQAAQDSEGRGEPATQALVEWQQPIVVARGEAQRGPWRMNRSDWRFVDDPTVAIDARGHVGVAWVDHTRKDVLFQLFGPDGQARLDEPMNVSQSPTIFSWLPRMVLGDEADPAELSVHLVWQEIVFSGGSHGGEIFHARSRDGGASWSAPKNLSNTTAGAGKGRLTAENWHNGSYDLIAGPGEELHVAWTEYEGNLWFSRSSDGGATFSEPLHVAGAEGELPARGPTLALGAEGRILLAFAVGEARAADIHLAISEDGGASFGAPRPVHERPGHADAPKLAVDSAGTVHLVYAESADGPFQRYRVHYSSARGDGLAFGEPREISKDQPGGFASVHFPTLCVDGGDRLYLAWELFSDHRGRPTALGFTRSSDGGRTFATPRVVPGTGEGAHGFHGSQQGLLMSKLAVNAAGELALVNSTFRQGDASRVWLWRGRPAAREDMGATGD